MKIELLANGSNDCPLIRFYGGDAQTFVQLKQAFERLASEETAVVALHDLPGVEALAGCCLVAEVGRRDRGIVRKETNVFSWILTPGTWDNVAGLIEPFCQPGAAGYQWLDQVPSSDARVLVTTSESGYW
jgi:hypothetical protein